MNKQKLATAGCIVLSIVFSLSFGLFIHFQVFLPGVNNVYEKTLYYSEDLYEEYYKEAVRMIDNKEYSCKYPVKTTIYSESDKTTLIIEIGDYDGGFYYSDCMTVTVKNLGLNEQEITFERSRENAEEAYKLAENYKNMMNIFTICFVLILIAFTSYLIINSIKRRYWNVFAPMIVISACVVIIRAMYKFLIAL